VKKSIFIIFIFFISCLANEKGRKYIDIDEEKLSSYNTNDENVLLKECQIEVCNTVGKLITTKSAINVNKNKGIVISLMPIYGYEATRIIIEGKYVIVINRETKTAYRISFNNGFNLNERKLNKFYFSVVLNNYLKSLKKYAYITDKPEVYAEWIKKNENGNGTYVYVERENYKIKEIYSVNNYGVIIISYKSYKIKDRHLPEEINLSIIKEGKSLYNINVKSIKYEIRKCNRYIYNLPRNYVLKDVKNLYELFESI